MTFTQTSFAPLHKALAAIAIAAMVLSSFAFAPLAFAGVSVPTQPDDAKVTICHANESGSFQTIHTSEHAPNGHFENNGTPKSGHEDDLLFPGEVDCPVTTGTITVTKVVVNDDGGSAKVKDFDLFVATTKVKSDHSEEFLPGTYAITESGAETANYDAVYTGACSTGSITVEAGKTYDCTITNNDKEPVVPPTYQCNDGLDNDGDGEIDETDPGCSGPTDDDETDPVVYICSDTIDNDGDGKTDFPADLGCANAEDGDETDAPVYVCSDGLDNDGDGKTDYTNDPGCTGPTDNDETDPVVPQTCTVTLVSNASDTTVVEKDGALAKLLTFVHSAWTASIPGASWIWGDDPVAPPVNGVVQNLVRQFGFVGDVTSAKLYVAADNTYVATLNSSPAGADLAENNFAAADEYDVASLINESGNNTLSFQVTNLPSSSNPAANPAGLMYKLVIEGNVTSDADCVPSPQTYQCSDSLDNDDDDKTDYPADPGCTGLTDNDEVDPVVPPAICQTSENLLLNGSFEESGPVADGGWYIFDTVANWAISSDGLELWRNFMGGASQGVQNAELDGNHPTTITQAVATIPGATYELRFDFSPRPQTSLADNSVDALADGVLLMNASADGASNAANVWTTHTKTFVAMDASTDIALADKGTDRESYGSLVDNVCLLKIADPAPMYTISGYKYNDLNGDGEQDDNEPYMAGWTITATEDEDTTEPETHSDVTDEYGYYSIEVPAGSWIVSEENREGWEQTTSPETCSFTVGAQERVSRLLSKTSNTCIFGNHEKDGGDGGDRYTIYGYVWHDENKNDEWDGHQSEEDESDDEDPLAGWDVRITNGSISYAAVTDANGYYEFHVPAGTWTITETMQNDWNQTFPNSGSHVVTVPDPYYTLSESQSIFASIMSALIPTALAQALPVTFGSYDFGNVYEPSSSDGGGGGSSSSRSPRCDAFELDGDELSWKTRYGYDLAIEQNGSEIFSTTDNDEVDEGTFKVTSDSNDTFVLTVNRGSKDDTCTIGGVLGASDSRPSGQVLGASDSMPVGAPNTGAGGTSPLVVNLPTLLAVLNANAGVRKAK
jgi:hypothetical protein